MNRERLPVILEQYVVRTIMTLSTAAHRVELDGLRDDLCDSAAMLIRLAIDQSSEIALREWCDRTVTLLDGVALSDLPMLSSAKLSVLRLRSSLAKEVKNEPAATAAPVVPAKRQPKTDLNKNQARLRDFIQGRPNIRMRELLAALKPEISERTIKRCLKDMVASGALERAQVDGLVQYSVTEKKIA